MATEREVLAYIAGCLRQAAFSYRLNGVECLGYPKTMLDDLVKMCVNAVNAPRGQTPA